MLRAGLADRETNGASVVGTNLLLEVFAKLFGYGSLDNDPLSRKALLITRY